MDYDIRNKFNSEHGQPQKKVGLILYIVYVLCMMTLESVLSTLCETLYGRSVYLSIEDIESLMSEKFNNIHVPSM